MTSEPTKRNYNMTILVNTSKTLTSEVTLFNASQIYSMHKLGKFFYDRERLQRLLNEWSDYKKVSYIRYLYNGGNFKDLFQIAKIEPIVTFLESKLFAGASNYAMVEENLEYFKSLIAKGYEYIVLDGQHRIDTIVRYFENMFEMPSNGTIVFQKQGESGKIRVEGKFSELPEEMQDHFRDMKLLVTVYTAGDLAELAQIFITSNDMLPMTMHERRILNYNPLNRWLVATCRDDLNIQYMFRSINGMSGEYDLDNKGDTLFAAEMLLYINNNLYEGYDINDLNDALGSRPTILTSDNERELTKKILRIMSDGCVRMNEKTLKKFTRSSLYNLFYTLSFLMQKGNHWSKQAGINQMYKIVDEFDFVTWFFDKEFERMNTPGTFTYYSSNTSKKQKKSVHDISFRKHNADQKHSSKESVKGEGGSRYDFTDWARVRYILSDLVDSLTYLENANIISKVGSRITMSRDEVIAAAGVPLSQSDAYAVHEVNPVSKGGIRELSNAAVIDKRQNAVLSDRPNNVKVING